MVISGYYYVLLENRTVRIGADLQSTFDHREKNKSTVMAILHSSFLPFILDNATELMYVNMKMNHTMSLKVIVEWC